MVTILFPASGTSRLLQTMYCATLIPTHVLCDWIGPMVVDNVCDRWSHCSVVMVSGTTEQLLHLHSGSYYVVKVQCIMTAGVRVFTFQVMKKENNHIWILENYIHKVPSGLWVTYVLWVTWQIHTENSLLSNE